MDYKGYSFRLCNVYKVENNKKLYALEIFRGTTRVFKSDWVYENEKRAYKDAKEMINKNCFDVEIIRKNVNKEMLKNDVVYKNQKINRFANSIIIFSIVLTIMTHVITAFGIGQLGEDRFISILLGSLYVGFGLLMVLLMMYWGLFANGCFELSNKQRKINRIIWWINLLFNKGPTITYNEQPFRDKQKGWYSSYGLITLVFETILGVPLIAICLTTNNLGLTFYGVVLSYVLLCINYIFSIIWEISNAKMQGEEFPFKRVVSPLLVIVIMAIFALFISKL